MLPAAAVTSVLESEGRCRTVRLFAPFTLEVMDCEEVPRNVADGGGLTGGALKDLTLCEGFNTVRLLEDVPETNSIANYQLENNNSHLENNGRYTTNQTIKGKHLH